MPAKNERDYHAVKGHVESWVETANSDPKFLAGATSGVTDEETEDVDVESVALSVKINFGWDVSSMDGPQFESVRIALARGGPSVNLVVDGDGGVIEGEYMSEKSSAYISDVVAERIYDYWKEYAEGVVPALAWR